MAWESGLSDSYFWSGFALAGALGVKGVILGSAAGEFAGGIAGEAVGGVTEGLSGLSPAFSAFSVAISWGLLQ